MDRTGIRDRWISCSSPWTWKRSRGARPRRPAARSGRRIQDRQAGCSRAAGRPRRGARRARRSGVPRSQVSRHPEHRRGRGRRGHAARRVDAQRPRLGRRSDDARGARRRRRRGRAPLAPAPLVIAVTMLTSLDQEALAEIGVATAMAAQVERLAALHRSRPDWTASSRRRRRSPLSARGSARGSPSSRPASAERATRRATSTGR